MKKYLSLLLLSSSLSLLATPASAQNNTTLEQIQSSGEFRFCFESGYMPFEMTDKKGDFIGFDIDIAKAMAKSINVRFVPVNTGWDGIIPALQTNKCDLILGMSVTPERNLSVNFADPYLDAGQTVLIRPELADTIDSYRQLNDAAYTVTAQLGTTGEFAIKRYLSQAKVRLFESSADAAQEVANGRADGFVYDISYNTVYAAQNPDRLVHLSQAFTYGPLGWAVRKGDADYLNFLNNFLRQIKGDGTYDRLYSKWFESDAWVSRVQ
ncbi:transporter substrate-binding domain-containing protein [Oceanisphaera psychrotolerans]|uniref:Amino acid ABC transporter substrate-binding protein n=1 Tax=Oceanisphaera psychrotolerans TaxID=1414654 RepID=A0A1J4QIB0_9GAMM|nr:transporter substrate-binding domain-containing protein [Oceanisphaera psychrotolerans]OIN14370.1 amino acid ABC transporter substrate-binding protein [Oceanisphaera psychrotolerans]